MRPDEIYDIEQLELNTPLEYTFTVSSKEAEPPFEAFVNKLVEYHSLAKNLKAGNVGWITREGRGGRETILTIDLQWSIKTALDAGFSVQEVVGMIHSTYAELTRSFASSLYQDGEEARFEKRLQRRVEELDDRTILESPLAGPNDELPEGIWRCEELIKEDNTFAAIALQVPKLRADEQFARLCWQTHAPMYLLAESLLQEGACWDRRHVFRKLLSQGPEGRKVALQTLRHYPSVMARALQRKDLQGLLEDDRQEIRSQALRFLPRLKETPSIPRQIR